MLENNTGSVTPATTTDWKVLDCIESVKHSGLSQFEEIVLEKLLQGDSPCKVSKALGCCPNTIYKRLRQNHTFAKHYKVAVSQGSQIKVDKVLDELLRIATEGKSEATRVKSSETFLKAHAKIVEHVQVTTAHDIEVDSVLKSLGL